MQQQVKGDDPMAEHDEGGTIDVLDSMPSYGPEGVRGLVSSGYVLGAACLASLGGFSFGYDQGVISIINVMPQFHGAIPQAETDFGKGLMTGMLLLGAFIGCIFMPYLADKISRKWALTVVVVIFDIGAIIQTVAQNYGMLVAGRTIGGIGVGTLAMGAPLYISEISPPNLRGTLLVLESICVVSGAVIAYWITFGTRLIGSEVSFRLPFGLQMVSATLLGLCIHFFPYSPRWLALVDRHDDCLKSLSKLRGLPQTDAKVQTEFRGIITEVKFQQLVEQRQYPGVTGIKREAVIWISLFNRRTWKRTAVGTGVTFFQQFVGINAFIYYAPTLFESIGQKGEMTLILSGVFNCLHLVTVIICFLIIDKVGRRPLAIFGGFAMGACYIIVAVLSALYGPDWTNTSAGWACVAMAFIFVLIFGNTYSPLGWALPSEVFPNAVRSKGVALSTCVNWLSNFIVGVVTPPMMANIGYRTYIFFAVWCVLAGMWAFFLVPETSGKTLEQIDEVFGDITSQEESEIMREATSAVIFGEGKPDV
ncbi:sugar porter family MFS transporter [Aspergillus ruber CBS 135680]|uniref:MFS monosaccharide transporter n=1 Tax=Aspergillus ruber (strain CBS 135680) TaxID=1388766 RepID=A0A017S0R6_ASPRC|nr:MFS monosaccharide transporter [Aspergillus ruber CBS 135680]EYE90436.1 MFS monosaccharide transporter [Aspergillus ruber CBS 135680]